MEVLLRLARHELFERAQQANRHFTALVDEEYVLTSFLCEIFFNSPMMSFSFSLGGGIASDRPRMEIIPSRYVAQQLKR